MKFKQLGAEAILTVIIAPTILAIAIPFGIWVSSSIYELKADQSDIKILSEKIEDLKSTQKTTIGKIDHLMDYLINRSR